MGPLETREIAEEKHCQRALGGSLEGASRGADTDKLKLQPYGGNKISES